MSKLFLLLWIFSSCSVSTVKSSKLSEVPLKEKTNYSVGVIFTSNLGKPENLYWKNIFLSSIAEYNVCNEGEECLCQLNVKYHDDRETFDSWKVYVSGLSLGLIPIRYNADYEVNIVHHGKREEYRNSVHTWVHVLFTPFFFLTPSKEMKTKEMASDVVTLLVNNCSL